MENGGGVVIASLPTCPPAFVEEGKCGRDAFRWQISGDRDRKLVCVTSGNSYLGAHIVKKLLARGYIVRATIQNFVDFEDMKELIREEEMYQLESVVVARMGDLDSLCDAFRGCHAIFHTSSFIDPHGVSGYTERMAFLEIEGARNVVEACSRTSYVKRCIFTSSLLASIWREHGVSGGVVNENCWSDEEFCRENKLWLALGKTTAEKVACRRARELKVKLVTVCPGLLMAPSFPNAPTETSIPYLKDDDFLIIIGGQIMVRRGLLATEDIYNVAEAHVFVYEDMDYGACGRYLCFGRVVRRLDEAIQLENCLKMHGLLSNAEETDQIFSDNLCNSKLNKLLFRASKRVTCKR